MSRTVRGMLIRDDTVRYSRKIFHALRRRRIRDQCSTGLSKAPLFAFFLIVVFLGSIILLGLARPGAISYPSMGDRAPLPNAVDAEVREAYGRLPLSFEANQGQTDPQVKFLSRGSQNVLFLTTTEAVLVLTQSTRGESAQGSSIVGEFGGSEARIGTVLRMTFGGANPTTRVTGLEERTGEFNYLIGNNPTKWNRNVPTYAKVLYEDLYPGIDLLFSGKQRQVEYDFVVHPGADPNQIVLGFQGADRVERDGQGNLVLHTALGPVRHSMPIVYQQTDGGRKGISGDYVLLDADRVSFRIGAYDVGRSLVIDPGLVYSTYLGGSGDDEGFLGMGIAIDAELTRGLELRERGANDKRTYRVHDKLGQPCYVCGTPIARVDYEEHTVYYCPTCQTGGRILKDRRLSRLLR